MTTTVAGVRSQLRDIARGVADPDTSRALRMLADKLAEVEIRLTDAERRLKAGSL